ITGALAKGLYTSMANRLAKKSSLSDYDWERIKELPADVRQQMMKDLPETHLKALADKAKADPETYGKMLEESGRTPVVEEDNGPVHFDTPEEDPTKTNTDVETVDADADKAVDNTTPDDAVVDEAPAKKTVLQTLNEGTVEELSALPGIGEERAKKIIADRESKGPFRGVSDISRVNGIGPATQAKVEQVADVNVLDVLNHGSK